MDALEIESARERIGAQIAQIRKEMQRHAMCGNPVLLPVTKTYPAWMINLLPAFGLYEIGENRVQEILSKKNEILPEIACHQIGQLQTNKVKSIIGFVKMVQSVDRPSLAEELEKQAQKIDRKIPILIEVNTSMEPQKGGVSPDDLRQLFELCQTKPHLILRGLMTVAPNMEENEVRSHFRRTKGWFDALRQDADANFDTLSMGMSGDYTLALEEGSTMVRIGSAIFGKRTYA